MTIKQINWYNFDIEKVKQRFEGDLEYIGDWDIRGQYQPAAVFRNHNPNRAKNHKDFMLLYIIDGVLMVGGIDKDEMEKYRYRKGLTCSKCGDTIFSKMRHDMTACSCNSCSIDGGADYFRISGDTGKLVTIDLIKMEVV